MKEVSCSQAANKKFDSRKPTIPTAYKFPSTSTSASIAAYAISTTSTSFLKLYNKSANQLSDSNIA